MKHIYKKPIIVFITLLFFSGVHAQVIFQENFNNISGPTAGGAGTYNFPTGWLLRNVDNRTPDAAVSYVNEAWERREDFNFNVADSAAFSTSWYSPVGAADDWMWTPPIAVVANANLSWRAVAYDPSFRDGYQVRVMASPTVPTGGSGVLGNQVTNSTQIFSIAAEASAWTTHTVSLNAYAGQTVRIAFRNNSNDKFLLLIDDIKVEVPLNYDAQMLSSVTNQYTKVPLHQNRPVTFSAVIKNSGLLNLTNVSLQANVFDASNVSVYSATGAATATMTPGTQATFTAPNFTPSAAGMYRVRCKAIATEADQVPVNDSISYYFEVSDSAFARDSVPSTGTLGIGDGNGGYLGQKFAITANSLLTSFSIFSTVPLDPGNTMHMGGDVFKLVNGVPAASPLYSAPAVTMTGGDPGSWIKFIIPAGGLPLSAGDTIVVVGREIDSTLAIGLTDQVFTAGSSFVNWPTNPFGTWAHNEDFGASFQKPYMIRPNLHAPAVVAVRWLSFNATAAGLGKALLDFHTEEQNTMEYLIERSSDGRNFITINRVAALGSGNHSYSYTDATRPATDVYYRITQKEYFGRYSISNIVKVSGKSVISVYPNPVKNTFTITGEKGTIANIYNAEGKFLRSVTLTGSSLSVDMSGYSPGTYVLKTKEETIKLVKE